MPGETSTTGDDLGRREDRASRDEELVEGLLGQMTLAEKVGQLVQLFYFQLPPGAEVEPALGFDPDAQPLMVEAALDRGRVGSLLFARDPATINRLQRRAIEGHRLGIPLLFGYDVIHGFRTVLPVPIAMAATWDMEVIESSQVIAAREARAVGIHWAFAPMVDIARDPRWGRIVEGAGEDPFLASAIAAAQVRGLQGRGVPAIDDEHVIAGVKHFAGYGAALGGRDYDEANLSDAELWNVYLPPFQAAIAAGAGSVMTAYMTLNDVPATGSSWLLKDVLRDSLGFEGLLVSDANAVRSLVTHGLARNDADAAVRALTAGVDLEMADTDPAYPQLTDAVTAGAVSEDLLDQHVRRVLLAKARVGVFDAPYVDENRARKVLSDPRHRETARVAAQRSAVLLKNDGVLPLALGPGGGTVASVAVLGPLAASRRDTLGPWIFDYDLAETTSVLDGIRAAVEDSPMKVKVDYAQGVASTQREFPSMFDMFGDNRPEDPLGFDPTAEFDRAVRIAASADVAVLVLGEWQSMIGEAASRSTMELPGRQQQLLQAVVATGTPTVLLLMSGRPLDLRWAAENVPAIMQIWYPGSQGGAAAADLLFGAVSPSGKLPFTWPRTVGQVPTIHSHTSSHAPTNQGRRYWDEASTPLYPFGHGLTFGQFSYADLTVQQDRIPRDGVATVSVDLTNHGDHDATETVQLYLHQRFGSSARPGRELKGFQRVVVPRGATRRVTLSVGPQQRRYWSAATRDWVLEASDFDVWVGGSSAAELHAAFSVD